jgi:cytochrome c peroxidase
MHRPIFTAISVLLVLVQNGCDGTPTPDNASGPAQDQLRDNPTTLSLAELGETIFFDERLSVNSNQACSVCHAPEVGFTGPDLVSNLSGGIYEGSIHNRFGGRKVPSSAYNVFAPVFTITDGEAVGGNFWDGRATGWRLGNPAAEQAQGPFLNPVEQALDNPSMVVELVCESPYKIAFKWLWGAQACQDGESEVAYDDIAFSIAAYETSAASSPFDSKYDAYLRGEATLTELEQQGLELFEGKALCAECHVIGDGQDALFTDFTYDNLGVPRNLSNPFYRMDGVDVYGQPINPEGFDWIDPGLGGFLQRLIDDDSWCTLPEVPDSMREFCDDIPDDPSLSEIAVDSQGKHKVPTLRNVALRPFPSFEKTFMHNGYFATLKGVVHFYNTRDVRDTCTDAEGEPADFPEAVALALDCWPLPEVPENVNTQEMGNLGLTDAEEDAVVAFLETLSDGFVPE